MSFSAVSPSSFQPSPPPCHPSSTVHTLYLLPCQHCSYPNIWRVRGDYNATKTYDFATDEAQSLQCFNCHRGLEVQKRKSGRGMGQDGWMDYGGDEHGGYRCYVRMWMCWACGKENLIGLGREWCSNCQYRWGSECVVEWMEV